MDIQPIEKLSKDLRAGAAVLGRGEARFLVDQYYAMQDDRKRSFNQELALEKGGEPNAVIGWLAEQSESLEGSIRAALDKFSAASELGQWARRQKGIGPVIAAGLLAYIDIRLNKTAGEIWSFAGQNPNATWKKGEKRPWNASLKTLVWKIGESFMKVSGDENAFYGAVYVKRRAYETPKNVIGDYAHLAAKSLRERKFDKETHAKAWYSGCYSTEDAKTILASGPDVRAELTKKLRGEPGSGVAMLPPSRMLLRSQKYAAKMFLSHYFEVGYKIEFGKAPPAPFAISKLGHAHYIPPPP